jgi:uncharacterized protein YndB with AHSA1/START domain
MTVVSSQKDAEALTFTFIAEFDASVERVWQVWEDPRQLERWWGPPSWPATFEQHDFVVGGWSRYHMTGPDGGKVRGWWTITAIEAPRRLEFDDGFADENGEPLDTAAPVHAVVTIESDGAKTRMTTVSTFTNAEQLETMADMGMEEGMRQSLGQIDDVLARHPA